MLQFCAHDTLYQEKKKLLLSEFVDATDKPRHVGNWRIAKPIQK